MARRSLHLTVSALVLLALLLSARLSAPAAHASSLEAGLHIGLKSLYSGIVVADINEPIKLAAAANEDQLPGNEHIVIGDWNGKGFSERLAHCGAGESACAATDPGGEEGTVKIKAAVVGPHGKILAKSSTVIITRHPLSLELEIGGPDGKPDSGSELGGTLVTMHVPEQPVEGSSWSKIVFAGRVEREDDDWQQFGSPCSLPCDQPTTGGAPDAPQTVDYEVQAVDPNGTVVKRSNVVSITYRPWTIDLRVNGAPISGDATTVDRHEPATISASVSDNLKVGNEQFHLIILDETPSMGERPDVAGCDTSPCKYTASPPGPDCMADCTHSYTVLVQNGSYNDGNSNYGKQPITITWQGESGFQFSGLTLQYTWDRATEPINECKPDCQWEPETSVSDTVSGFVCGDPYKDQWTIMGDFSTNFSGSTYHQSIGGIYTFDPTTELAASQKEFADAVAPAPEHIAEPYVKLYLHGTADPSTGAKTPDTAELSMDVPADVQAPHQIPVPGSSLVEVVRLEPPSGSSTAKVIAKADCP